MVSGSIEPLASEYEMVGKKAGIDFVFSVLLASSITLKTFDRMFDVLKTWLEYRRSARVFLKFEDGCSLELTHLTKSEALEFLKKYEQEVREQVL